MMARRRSTSFALVVWLTLAGPAVAQTVVDPSVRHLEFEHLRMLLFPDPASGVYLWAAWWNIEEPGDYIGRFDPAELGPWLERARRVVNAPDPERRDTTSMLSSGTVRDIDHGDMYLLRYRDGRRWEGGTVLVLRGTPSTLPMAIELSLRHTRQILDILAEIASETSWQPELREWLVHANPAVPPSQPKPHPDNPSVHYPTVLLPRNVQGDVWYTYVLDHEGRPEVDGVRVLMSDHELFTRACLDILPRQRFEPATRNGRPVLVRMFHRAGFRLTRFE